MQELLQHLVCRQDLSYEQSRSCAHYLLNQPSCENMQSALLIALSTKGETLIEIQGFVDEILSYLPSYSLDYLNDPVVDLCGTGGDSLSTLNISTLSSIVVAATQKLKVAKHGNRSVSGLFGSADILESLDICIQLSPDIALRCLEDIGITFLYAPFYHPLIKNISSTRKKLGVRTLFNLIGPLLNPFPIHSQTMGLFSSQFLHYACSIGHQLGRHMCTLHSFDGMDEISPEQPTELVFQKLDDPHPRSLTFSPCDFSFSSEPLTDLVVSSKEQAETLFLKVLQNKPLPSAVVHSVLFNSALSLWFTLDMPWESAFQECRYTLESGLAWKLFCRWQDFSHRYKNLK